MGIFTGHKRQDVLEYQAPDAPDYGGTPGGASEWHDYLAGRMGDNSRQQSLAREGADWAQQEFQNNRGDQASEDPTQVARFNESLGQQQGALGLMGTAARGGAPSAAEFGTGQQMNDIMAQRSGAMGTSRGLSALTGSQSGALMGQASSAAAGAGGMARSQEILSAMGQYGGLAGTVRGENITRMGQDDAMSQFNSGLNNQHRIDMGNAALGYGNLQNSQAQTNQGWDKLSQHPWDEQAIADMQQGDAAAGMSAGSSGEDFARNKKSNQEALDMGVNAGVGLISAGAAYGAKK